MSGAAVVHGDARSLAPAGAGRHWAAAWLLPDLATAAALLTLVYCLFFFQGYEKLFRDSDTGWHIRAGEALVAGSPLPHADPYSFSVAGRPWFAWEWLSDVAMGGVHRVFGLSGVALLYAAAIASGVWLWFRLSWAAGGDFLFSALLAAPMLTTSGLHWLARPHIFSWLFLLGLLCFLEAAPPWSFRSQALLAAAGSALWANVHASFFLAPGLLLLYGVCRVGTPLVWSRSRDAAWRQGSLWIRLGAISALATFATPYGWELHAHVFRYLTDGELIDRIGEFLSFNFHAEGAGQIVAMMLVAMLGVSASIVRRRPEHAVLIAVLVAGALRSARGLPLVALLALPLANGAITAALRGAHGLAPAFARRLEELLAYSGRLRQLDRQAGGWLLIPVTVLLCVAALRLPAVQQRTGFPPADFPVAAAEALEQLPPPARLFAPDKFGGYLIYRFSGSRKVFFDGRSDLYGAEFLKEYAQLTRMLPGWTGVLAKWRFTHALLPAGMALIEGLEVRGWRRVYADATAVLLQAPEAVR